MKKKFIKYFLISIFIFGSNLFAQSSMTMTTAHTSRVDFNLACEYDVADVTIDWGDGMPNTTAIIPGYMEFSHNYSGSSPRSITPVQTLHRWLVVGIN